MSLSSFSRQDRERAGMPLSFKGKRGGARPGHIIKAGMDARKERMREYGANGERIYLEISEVAEMFEVTAATVRYWLGEFRINIMHRDSKGHRKFTKADIERVREVHRLLKVELYTMEGAKRQLAKRSSVDVRGEQAKPSSQPA